MTEHLQTIIEAAERAAEAIRSDAEKQAGLHLAEVRLKADRLTAERVRLLSELTDDLIRHAATVRNRSEQMLGAFDDAIRSASTKLDRPVPAEAAAAPPASPSLHATSAGGQWRLDSLPASAGEAVSVEALVFATRMAVAGTDRAAMAAALRTRFGVNDPEAVVARVMGEASLEA